MDRQAMFGLDFLFATMLWALPLAGLPVLLHLLFRRKSPVVQFPTLRFIRSSLQHTAARRRIQRWLLLATRMLLLLLLIWAIAQPVRILASGWLASGKSMAAAIVVDCSYSMQLRDQQVARLDTANDIVARLLRGPLSSASIALFANDDQADHPTQLEPAARVASQWVDLKPQPAVRPLSERIAAARDLLARQVADQKWLVVISDLQSREFPRPLPDLDEADAATRLVLFDLRPADPRNVGITAVRVEPRQPIPGIGTEVAVELVGRAGDARAVVLRLMGLDGRILDEKTPLMATFDAGGRATVRFPLPSGLPPQRWVLAQASLQGEDALTWDDQRAQLVEMPPRQSVQLIDNPSAATALRFVSLALDPMEGREPAWPLVVGRGPDLSGREQVAVLPLTQWPSELLARRLADFARGGGAVLLMLQPGLESLWPTLDDNQRAALLTLLPQRPADAQPLGAVFSAAAAVQTDPLIEGLIDPSFDVDAIAVRRFVPFLGIDNPAVTMLLSVSPTTPLPGSRPAGLLYRRALGAGTVYTLTTLPEPRYTNLATHPLFLPLLVRAALRPPEQSRAQNNEIGQSLALAGAEYAPVKQLEVLTPAQALYAVMPTDQVHRFVFDQAHEPGLYTWRRPGDSSPLAIANVQPPAAEADLVYKPADVVVPPGPNVLVVRSFAELESNMARINEPQPRWSPLVAAVLLLICVEALLGSLSQLWKPMSLRSLLPFSRSAA